MSQDISVILSLQTAQALEKLNGFIGSAVSGLRELATEAAAAFIGMEGILKFEEEISGAIKLEESIGRLASKTGLSIPVIAALKESANDVNVPFEELNTSLGKFSQNIYDAATKGGDAKEAFDRMGVAIVNIDGSLRSADDVLIDSIRWFGQHADGVQKARFATELFGKAGRELIPVLNQSDTLIDRIRVGGGPITPQTVAQATAFEQEVRHIHEQMEMLWIQIANTALPTLNRWAKALSENIEVIFAIGAALSAAVVIVKGSTLAFNGLISAITSLGVSAEAASLSIGVVGAAMSGWAIGTWIGDIKLLGFNISDYLVLPMLQAEKAIIHVQKLLGGMSDLQAMRQLHNADLAIHDIMFPPAPSNAAAKTPQEGSNSNEIYSLESFKEKQQELELVRESLELGAKKLEMIGDQALKEMSMPRILQQENDLLNEEYGLISDAEKSVLSHAQASQMRLQIEKALLAVEKEKMAFSLDQTKLFMDSLNHELQSMRDEIKLKAELYQSSPILDEVEKRRQLLQSLAEEKRAIEETLHLLQQKYEMAKNDAERKAIADDYSGKAHDLSSVNASIIKEGQNDPTNWTMNFAGAFAKIKSEWGGLAQQMATTFSNTFNTAVNSISSGITSLIMETKTWNQALLEIGTTIVTEVIQSFVKMAVEWVAQHLVMAVAGKAIMAAATASLAPLAAAQAAIWATPATLSTIASYGASADAAPGFITAAEGVVQSSVAGREFGGPVTAGVPYIVGEKRPELFVPAADGFIMPHVPSSAAAVAAAQGGGSGSQNQPNVAIHVWGDQKKAMSEAIKANPTFDNHIVDTVNKNAHKIIPRRV